MHALEISAKETWQEDLAGERNIFKVWAEPNRNGPGFIGLYQAPGIATGMIRDMGTMTPEIFDSEGDARLAAMERLFEVINTPRKSSGMRTGKDVKYERLSGQEFSELLRQSGLTLTLFAYLYGTNMKRATFWLDGRDDKGNEELAPHPVRVMLELFIANKANIDIAESVTDACTAIRRPRD